MKQGRGPWPWPAIRLWVQLAAFAALGVAATHAIHLVIGGRIASRAVAYEQEALGRDVARLVAQQAADPVLLDDRVTLHEIVTSAGSAGHVAYCFIERGDKVLASSFPGSTPAGLVSLRRGNAPLTEPLVVRSKTARYLDIAEPILSGSAGVVRLGMDLGVLQKTRRELAASLGLVAVAVIGAGVAAAFLVGRRIARPVSELLSAADRFDPSVAASPVVAQGSSELVQLAERFNQMTVRLKSAHDERQEVLQKSVATERLVALGSLAAGVAHEINNPLAGLKNCHRLLKEGDLSEPKRREYFDLMGDSLERIEDAVQRLLEFGRPQPLVLRDEQVADLARAAAGLAQPLLRERRIEWKTELPEALAGIRVRADRRQFGQALLNLILNAAYVTAEGGQIRLRLRRRPPLCGFSIEDDGPGISPEIRDRILDPFFSTKPEGKGTGLGLPVTRKLADAHGGELTFDFPERGTVATLWLRETSAG